MSLTVERNNEYEPNDVATFATRVTIPRAMA